MIDIFHSKDEMFIQTGLQLHQWSHSKQDWINSIKYGLLVEQPIKSYVKTKYNDTLALLFQFLGQAFMEIGDISKAGEYLHQANELYLLAPGPDHPFYQHQFLPLWQKFQDVFYQSSVKI